MIVYYVCMQYYRRTSRELQRLDSISRSPIYNHFAETLNGRRVCARVQRHRAVHPYAVAVSA